jgi:predicted cupin superfamily sugar epimerase
MPVDAEYIARLADETISRQHLPARYHKDKPYQSAIVYFFDGSSDCFSAMHCLATDEIFHFLLGDPIELLLLYPDGHSKRFVLGQDVLNGQYVQFVVPRGVWQGSHLLPGGQYALIGTTMAPAYANEDFTVGDCRELCQKYPGEADLIKQLTHS